ncbi:MAG: glycyl-radical enzyme activating protein [Desulfotignum sp.]|nr:glycyl-radical enzyme activating protein [Desulfotignum sp.]
MISLSDTQQKGIVFNIQKYSLHDGEGIRTIVFFKGCSLVCKWCSNPESQQLLPELGCNPDKCLTTDECSRCEDLCPEKALISGHDKRIRVDTALCTNCLKCTDVCPTNALNAYGYEITVADVLKRVEEDSMFYLRSGGGLTLSGGEPLFQARFAISLLREARKRRIDTNIETCGNIAWPVLEEAANYLNSIYYDLKLMDTEKHKEFTGFDNILIKENLIRLAKKFPNLPIKVRTPVIPGVNDTIEEIQQVVSFIKDLPNISYELLAYHRMGTPKYAYLGRKYPMGKTKNLSEERFEELTDFCRSKPLPDLAEF